MDFSFSPEQSQIGDSLRRYLAKDYSLQARMRSMKEQHGFSNEHWHAFADMGILALNVPEVHGGLAARDDGGNPVDTLVVMRELGRALVIEPVWMSAVVCANVIALSGNDAAASSLLPSLADGSTIFALAALEHGGRYDFSRIATKATKATKSGDTWTLEGRKSVVLHGAHADKLLVTAKVDGGIAIFVVDGHAHGLHIVDCETVDGFRAAEVTLHGVPAETMLAGSGVGAEVITRAAERAGAALCGEALGIVEALTDTTNEYLKTRKQFGVPIGKFQSLQHRAADMLVCVEQVRAMAYYAAAKVAVDDPVERSQAIAAARAAVAEASKFVSKNAVQLHGGMGVTDELIVSHYVKRLAMLNQTYGDYEHHLAAYAAAMET